MSKKKIKIEYGYPEWIEALKWIILSKKIEDLQRKMQRNSFFYLDKPTSKATAIDLSKEQ